MPALVAGGLAGSRARDALAEELGARHAHFNAAALYRATVAPDAILGYLECRDEGWTVVVDPAGITCIEKLKDIHGSRR